MSLARRSSNRFNTAIWPGFVDAMTALLLVLTFVLSIFMIMQFLLQETISDQELELDELGSDLAALANSLGLERQRNTNLQASLGAAQDALTNAKDEVDTQSQLIATLTSRVELQQNQLSAARSSITNFESQIAALLLERDDALAIGAQLRDANEALTADQQALAQAQAELLSERDSLSLALAATRSEVDAQAEAARLAAAKREALDALVADLQAEAVSNSAAAALLNQQLTDLKAQELALTKELSAEEESRLAEAAAADALRRRLAEADDELTAMTLALEAKRKEAEDTLTLLAAAKAAEADLNARLAAALLEGENLVARLGAAAADGSAAADEIERLEAALAVSATERSRLSALVDRLQTDRTTLETQARDTAQTVSQQQEQLAQLTGSLAELENINADLQQQLDQTKAAAGAEAAGLAADLAELRATVARLEQENAGLRVATVDTATVRDQLTAALAAKLAAESERAETLTKAQERALLLAQANEKLSQQEAKSAEDQRRLALLNEQVAALRTQLGTLQGVLDAAAEDDAAANVQIQALGNQLNTALARVAAEERKRAELEEAERKRLEAEAEELKSETRALASYRSEFFGRLREILGRQEGVRIVGDRFVFSSEVLFSQGSAELSEAGQREIAKIAALLRNVAADIPPEIDWIIRVDGHTDNVPLSGLGEFADNWELSQARALSVVRYMQNSEGMPPSRLAANGFGEYQPIANGNSDEARAQNRRIELKLTEK